MGPAAGGKLAKDVIQPSLRAPRRCDRTTCFDALAELHNSRVVVTTRFGRMDASMRIGVPQESWPGETLVAMTPKTADQLIKLGYELVVEAGAGGAAKFADGAYEAAGVKVAPTDVILKVNEPNLVEVARLSEGAVILARMGLGDQPELFQALNARRATGLSLDAIPRISRAQSMDSLSTMS